MGTVEHEEVAAEAITKADYKQRASLPGSRDLLYLDGHGSLPKEKMQAAQEAIEAFERNDEEDGALARMQPA